MVSARGRHARCGGAPDRPRRVVHVPRSGSAGRLPDPGPRRDARRCRAPAPHGGGRDPRGGRAARRARTPTGRPDRRMVGRTEGVRDRRPPDAGARDPARLRDQLRHGSVVVRRDHRVWVTGSRRDVAQRARGPRRDGAGDAADHRAVTSLPGTRRRARRISPCRGEASHGRRRSCAKDPARSHTSHGPRAPGPAATCPRRAR